MPNTLLVGIRWRASESSARVRGPSSQSWLPTLTFFTSFHRTWQVQHQLDPRSALCRKPSPFLKAGTVLCQEVSNVLLGTSPFLQEVEARAMVNLLVVLDTGMDKHSVDAEVVWGVELFPPLCRGTGCLGQWPATSPALAPPT